MKVGANMHYNSKVVTTPKAKSRSKDLYLNRHDLDSKPILNIAPTSTRYQFTSFSDINTSEYGRQHTNASTPKMANSSNLQSNLSNSATKGRFQINSDSKKSFLSSEIKNEAITYKSQTNVSKHLNFSKTSSETSNSSKKIDTSLGIRKSNNATKTDSRGASKDEKYTLESPENKKHRKERLFGSYDPTPTNSEHKKPPLQTEMASTGKKGQDFDLRDLLTSKKMTTSPSKRTPAPQENLYSQKESAYNASRNLFLSQKTPNITDNRVERGKNAHILFNNLVSPSTKANQRSLTKDHTRSFHELETSKHNNSNDSIHPKAKTLTSTLVSNANRTPSNSKLNDSSKLHPYSNYSHADISSGSGINLNAQGVKESKSTLSFASLYKEKRGNYQEILRGKREEYDKSYANQSTANQTNKSSSANINSLEISERFFNSKNSNLNTEINNKLAVSTKSKTAFRSLDAQKQRDGGSIERYEIIADNILSEDPSLVSPQKQYPGKSVTETQSRSNLEECSQFLTSEPASKNDSRSPSAAQNIQEILEFEKKKHEALKNRISLNLEAFRANRSPLESADGLNTAQSKANESSENRSQVKALNAKETNYQKSTKHVMNIQNSEFESENLKHVMSIEHFETQDNQKNFVIFNNERFPAFEPREFLLEAEPANNKQREDNGLEANVSYYKGPTENPEVTTLSHKNIAFIEYEEVPITEQERRINSRERKHTYKLESDRTDQPTTERHQTSRSVVKSGSPEPDSLLLGSHVQNQPNKVSQKEDAETIAHLLKLVERLKKVLVEDRNREQALKNENSHMQKRIEELELRLSKYES